MSQFQNIGLSMMYKIPHLPKSLAEGMYELRIKILRIVQAASFEFELYLPLIDFKFSQLFC